MESTEGFYFKTESRHHPLFFPHMWDGVEKNLVQILFRDIIGIFKYQEVD